LTYTATSEFYTLSLHDALPICIFTDQPNIIEGQIIQETLHDFVVKLVPATNFSEGDELDVQARMRQRLGSDVNITIEKVTSIPRDRKSTRLNSSHVKISYAVFC